MERGWVSDVGFRPEFLKFTTKGAAESRLWTGLRTLHSCASMAQSRRQRSSGQSRRTTPAPIAPAGIVDRALVRSPEQAFIISSRRWAVDT